MTLRRRRRGRVRMASLSENVTDQIIKLSAAESLPVVDGHGMSSFPLDRNQAGLHEQVKLAIVHPAIAERRYLHFESCRKTFGHPAHGCNRLWRFPGRPENRIANFVRRMISRETCEVASDELSSASDLVAGEHPAFPEKRSLPSAGSPGTEFPEDLPCKKRK